MTSSPSPTSRTLSNSTVAPGSAVELLDADHVAFADPILFAARRNDGVHDLVTPKMGPPGAPAERGANSTDRGRQNQALRSSRAFPSTRSGGYHRAVPTGDPARMPLGRDPSAGRDDLRRVDQVIVARLASDVALVNQVAALHRRRRRQAPAPAARCCSRPRACGYEGDRHVEAAAIIEFIHTATLLHDDVVDGSDLRRGRDTANDVFGNAASVLVGDFLYSRAFQMMVDLGDMRILEVMADATNTIAEGEVLQLMNAHDPGHHRSSATSKSSTARPRSCSRPARRSRRSSPRRPRPSERCMAEYGRHLGTAFQLVDDVLDYRARPSRARQEPRRRPRRRQADAAADLCAGTRARRTSDAAAQRASKRAGCEDFGDHRAIESTGGLEYTARLARREAISRSKPSAGLPESAYRQGLARSRIRGRTTSLI